VERPIILKAHEVRGILDGRQTQLRRIVKPPRWAFPEEIEVWEEAFTGKMQVTVPDEMDTSFFIECPFGQVGDRLWVKETFGWLPDGSNADPEHGRTVYRATDDIGNWCLADRWKSSTQMPRSVSRILLVIVSVRVERLQDISEADAVAQGYIGNCGCPKSNCRVCMAHAPTWFQSSWMSTDGADTWNANPWVWVIEFKRVDA
jgi:hypothetical protein